MARKTGPKQRTGNNKTPSKKNDTVQKSGETAKPSNKSQSKSSDNSGGKISNGATENTTRKAESPQNWRNLNPADVKNAQTCFEIGVKSVPQLIIELEKKQDSELTGILQCFLAPMIPIKHHKWIIDDSTHMEKCLMIANLISNFFQGYSKGYQDAQAGLPDMIVALMGPKAPAPPMKRPPGR